MRSWTSSRQRLSLAKPAQLCSFCLLAQQSAARFVPSPLSLPGQTPARPRPHQPPSPWPRPGPQAVVATAAGGTLGHRSYSSQAGEPADEQKAGANDVSRAASSSVPLTGGPSAAAAQHRKKRAPRSRRAKAAAKAAGAAPSAEAAAEAPVAAKAKRRSRRKKAAGPGESAASSPLGHEAGPDGPEVQKLAGALKLLKNVMQKDGQEGEKRGASSSAAKAKKTAPAARGKTKAAVASSKDTEADASASPSSASSKRTSGLASSASGRPRSSKTASSVKKPRYDVHKVNSRRLELTPVEENKQPVPRLAYGLDRVLFNPGVYHLQDPRSRVFNFDPYLATIMPIREFDFNALRQYVTSSKDTTLAAMAVKYQRKYSGSTSSMTSMLSHFHFLLSGWRPINPAHTSRHFKPESFNFTRITKAPAAVFLHWRPADKGGEAVEAGAEGETMTAAGAETMTAAGAEGEAMTAAEMGKEEKEDEENAMEDSPASSRSARRKSKKAPPPRLAGTYAIDADKEFDTANVLSMLGKSMEKLLTLSKADFEKYRISKAHELTAAEREQRDSEPESFHYTTFGDFMMRSQLDAYDPRVPGTGMFDLKTRAVVSIRMDAQDFHRGLGYEIRQRIGQWESFEREYFDMIRSAFLKYSLQVRMGRMDGIYVAFHNTRRIFGFQYISIDEMDLALHGSESRLLGDREFLISLHMLNAVLDRATERFPGRSLRLHIETRPSEVAPFMYVFARPVTDREIEEVQNANKASVEAFEKSILGMGAERGGEQPVEEGVVEEEEEEEEEGVVEEGVVEEEEKEEGVVGKEKEEEEEDDEDDESRFDVWESMRQKVEQTIENETLGLAAVRDTIEDALEQSGLLRGRSTSETRGYVDDLLAAVTRPDTESVAQSIHRGGPLSDEAAAAEEDEEDEDDDDEQALAAAQSLHAGDCGVSAWEPALSGDLYAGLDGEAAARAEEPRTSAKTAAATATEPETDGIIFEAEAEPLESAGEAAAQVVSAPPASSSSPDDTLSLKDLIIKLAAQIEASQAAEEKAKASRVVAVAPAAAPAETTPSSSPSVAAPELDDGHVDLGSADSAAAGMDVEAFKNKRFERILSEMMALSKADKDKEKSAAASASSTASPVSDPADEELLGLIITIRNKVNGRYVKRPERLGRGDSWSVEYAMEEIPTAPVGSNGKASSGRKAQKLYEMILKRRRSLLTGREEDDGQAAGEGETEGEGAKKAKRGETSSASAASVFSSAPRPEKKSTPFDRLFIEKLHALSDRGRRYRQAEDRRAQQQPVRVYGVDAELAWTDVFTKEGK